MNPGTAEIFLPPVIVPSLPRLIIFIFANRVLKHASTLKSSLRDFTMPDAKLMTADVEL